MKIGEDFDFIEDIYFEDFNKIFDKRYIEDNIPIKFGEKQMFRLFTGLDKVWYFLNDNQVIKVEFNKIYLWYTNYQHYFLFSLKSSTRRKVQVPKIAFDSEEELRDHLLKTNMDEIKRLENKVLTLGRENNKIRNNFDGFKKLDFKIN